MAKQTKIIIETESLLVLHGHTSMRAWCPQCGSDVEMVALESTAVESNLTPAEVAEWLASEELHHSFRDTFGICFEDALATQRAFAVLRRCVWKSIPLLSLVDNKVHALIHPSGAHFSAVPVGSLMRK